MVIDTHLHTYFSDDSDERLDVYCEKAVEKGVNALIFTDHVDFNPHDNGYGYYNSERFFGDLAKARQKYDGKLTLLAGMEFGEPYVYPDEFLKLSSMPYDFILGSMHFWMNDLFASEVVNSGVSCEEAFQKYYSEMKKMLLFGGIDSVAHFDFPKRYYKQLFYEKNIVIELFDIMVKKGIALEINSSGLRKGQNWLLPDDELLSLYCEAGGKYYTFGSDAHNAMDLNAGHEIVTEKAKKYELTEVFFVKRQMIEIR